MLKDHILKAYCSRSMLLLQEHIANMLLEQCAFQIWFWRIFDLENFFQIMNGPGP